MTLAVSTKEPSVFGNKAIAFYYLTAVADTNTLATGFASITDVIITPETAIACGATWSGGTITFKIASTTPNLRVMVIGD